MSELLMMLAKRIPKDIRKHILKEDFIDKANNLSDIANTPMHYLFEMYEVYLDTSGEFNNWYCPKCRDHILKTWRELKSYLQQLEQQIKA